jgi:hypothetical protein
MPGKLASGECKMRQTGSPQLATGIYDPSRDVWPNEESPTILSKSRASDFGYLKFQV